MEFITMIENLNYTGELLGKALSFFSGNQLLLLLDDETLKRFNPETRARIFLKIKQNFKKRADGADAELKYLFKEEDAD